MHAKQYKKATYKKWYPNDKYNKQQIKDKETLNKRIFNQLLKEEEWESSPGEISLIKEFKQNDKFYGLGSAGNKLSEHSHSYFKKEYQLIVETQLAQGLITRNEYYKKLKKFKI